MAIAVTAMLPAAAAVGPYDTQTFFYGDGWFDTTSSGNSTWDSWKLIDGYENMNEWWYDPFDMPESRHSGDDYDCAVWLTASNSAFVTPQLPGGAGTITFWLNNVDAGVNSFALEYSLTGGAPWTTVTNLQYTAEIWSQRSVVLNVYDSCYVRIRKTGDSGGGANGQLLGIDDLTVIRPPAYVIITNVATSPQVPVISTEADITCDILTFSDLANMTVTSYWRVFGASNWNAIAMQPSGGDSWTTVNPIPPQAPSDTFLQYWIHAEFDGTDAMSPTNYPPDATNTVVPLLYRQPVYFSNYSNILVIGTFNTNLYCVDDYFWQGVVSLGTDSVTDAPFRFKGTNAGGSTIWGDDDQSHTAMPVFGVVETSGGNITMGGVNTGHLLFTFDEATGDYSAQKCQYASFDGWTNAGTFGTYSNAEGWIIADCRLTTNSVLDDDHVLRGRSCVMDEDAGSQYIRSPYLSAGVGEIAFSYRNWETNGAYPTDLAVQVAPNVTGPWQTIATVSTIRNADYLRFSTIRSDRDNHCVRVLRLTNQNAKVCIDELVVAEPGPGVLFSAPNVVPPVPSILQTVDIDSTATLVASATAPTCTLWYAYNTNFPYTAIPMTEAALTFSTESSIPRMPVGQVYYYIECEFQGMRSTRTETMYHPVAGPDAPSSYTVTNWCKIQTFDFLHGWYDTPSSGNSTWGGWELIDGYENMNEWWYDPFDMPKSPHPEEDYDCAVWLTTTNSALISEKYAYGVGTFSFQACNLDFGQNWYSIQYSGSPTGPWTNVVTNLVYSSELWSEVVIEVNLPDQVHMRILKTCDSGADVNDQLLGLDDIKCVPPPAMVAITSPMTHPGYPASNETVHVSCTIESIGAFRAFNTYGKLWYRTGGSGPFTNSILISRVSDDHFQTVEPMPAFPMYTLVEYYIEALFDGYASSDEYRYSPTYLPAGIAHGTNTHYFTPPVSGFFNYTVRPYMSDFDVLQVTGTVPHMDLEQQDDYVWQGIIDFGDTTVTNPTMALSGLAFYTGTNYSSAADTWADIYQTRTTIPMFSVMRQGATNALEIAGEHTGQYVFRFNEQDRSYILHRCVFEDFNVWYADEEYFTESWSYASSLPIVTNDFDDHWLSLATPLPEPPYYVPWPVENFQVDWTVTTNYVGGEVDGGNGWIINQAKIIWQLNNDKGCQLRNDPSTIPYLRPIKETQTEGVGTFSFEYRCLNTNHHPTLYWAATNWGNTLLRAELGATELPVNESGLSFGECHISLYQRYTDPNNYYELRLIQTDLNQRKLQLYRKNGPGDPQLVKTFRTDGGTIEDTPDIDWLVWTAGAGKVNHEIWWNSVNRYACYENGTGLTAQNGAFGIDAANASVSVKYVAGGWGQLQECDNWSDGTWNNFDTNQQWIAKYAIVGNEVQMAKPADYTGAYLRSPLMPHGVSRIRFRYRTIADYRPYKFIVQWSNTGSDNDGDWTTIETRNVPSSNQNDTWQTYDEYTNLALNNVYVRVRVADDSANRVWVDEFSIRPNYNAPQPAMYETFDDDVADGWTNPGGWWYCTNGLAMTNGVYNRPGYTATPISFVVQTANYDDRLSLPMEGVWNTRTTFVARTQTKYNSVAYHIRDSGTNDNTRVSYVRIKQTGGNGSLVLDNVHFDAWHGVTLTDTSKLWRAREAWLVDDGSGTNNYLELSRSRSYIENFNQGNQRLRSAGMTNGIGVLVFRTSRFTTNSPACTYEVQWALNTNEPVWNVLRAYTNDTTGLDSSTNEWKYHAVTLATNATAYFQIVHTSTNPTARLLIDDMEVTGYFPRDQYNWFVYNGLVTHLQKDRLWETGRDPVERSAYLNWGRGTYDDTPVVMSNYMVHVQSPKLASGIGEISFWYKNWTDTSDVPATLRIVAAPDYRMPENEWVEIGGITNFVAHQWRYYRQVFYNTTNRFVRFYAVHGMDRICIDDIMIMDPLGADLLMENLVTVPAIPLAGEPVYVQVDLAQFLLDVDVTSLECRYVVGTNNWADWSPGTVISMSQVTNDPLRGSFTWRTDSPIPGYPRDTTVQYYVNCEFDGQFADKGGSPKEYKEFVNPAHYDPIDHNERWGDVSNRIPYYIVFSCLPRAVWINELNTTDGTDVFLVPTFTNEYIELCGPNNTDIGDWRLEIVNENEITIASYLLSNAAISNTTPKGYGFWTLGDAGVPNVDMVFTNIVSGGQPQQSMPQPVGGVRLVRSMGAVEYEICYGQLGEHPPNLLDFEYIGDDPYYNPEDIMESWTGGLALSGPVTAVDISYTNWTWSYGITNHTPGAWNPDQVPSGTVVVVNVTIVDMAMLNGIVRMDYTMDGGTLGLVPWYSTNLIDGSWTKVGTYSGPFETAGTYTVTFDMPTEYPVYFYKIVNP